MNDELNQLLFHFQQSQPPQTRTYKLLLDALGLIPQQSYSQLAQLIIKHSCPVQLYNVKQCMLYMAPWIHWVDRLSCMAVNREWREAIRQPELWQSCFGMMMDQGLGFPFSARFVRSMQSCWSQLQIGVALVLPLTNKQEAGLHQWLDLIPGARVDSVTITFDDVRPARRVDAITMTNHDASTLNRTDLVRTLISLAPRISTSVRELALSSGANYKCLIIDGNFEFSALEQLTVYAPFHKCFLRAPNLTRLHVTIGEVPSTEPNVSLMRTPTPVQCYPRLETARFVLDHQMYKLQLKYYRHLTWPKSLHCVELVGRDMLMLLFHLYTGDNTTNLAGVPIRLVMNFNGFHVSSQFHFMFEQQIRAMLLSSKSSLLFHSVYCVNFERPTDDPFKYLDEFILVLKDLLKWSDQYPLITTD